VVLVRGVRVAAARYSRLPVGLQPADLFRGEDRDPSIHGHRPPPVRRKKSALANSRQPALLRRRAPALDGPRQ
jgi:hypothetical protein